MTTFSKLQKYLAEIEKNDKKGNKINSFLQLRPEKELTEEAKLIDDKIKKGKAGKLAGQIIGVKANINVRGLNISCASKTLENYKAPYDATVVKRIKQEDGLIIGICNMDEFACGSSGETSAFGPTKSPVNPEMNIVAGGTSSGSAASVSANFCDLSLGSDTGSSIRIPANNCGVVGLKPSYGSVSRYGLIDLSMSLDQIGPLARTVSECALLFDVIKGKDENDSISFYPEKFDLNKIEQIPKNITIGLLDFEIKDKRIQKLIDDKVNLAAKKYNWKIKKIKISNLDLAIATYYPLVYVEFFSGTRRFDGRRYGKRIEESCGPEVLRRILGGSEISKAEFSGRYYHLALKSKKLISDGLAKLFEDVDCIISPVIPRLPHKIGSKISVEEMYAYDALTIHYNLYGNCAISIPSGEIDKIPVGMQIACDRFQEQKLFQISYSIEKL
ncbi:MAG: amidase family protein [Nanoarchaeota archaeon]